MIKEKNIIKTMYYESPCGILMLGSYDNKLCLCDWQIEKHRNHINRRLKRILNAKFEEGTSDIIEKAIKQLDEFFAGKRQEFDIPLLFVGTDFQKKVWSELLKIPFGETISYGKMATRIGIFFIRSPYNLLLVEMIITLFFYFSNTTFHDTSPFLHFYFFSLVL